VGSQARGEGLSLTMAEFGESVGAVRELPGSIQMVL
jgi:hypothetical protein